MSIGHKTETRRFVSDVIWVGVSQLTMSLAGLAILPALTKGYPVQIYGIWSQMLVTVGLLHILTLKFDSAMIRFLAAEEDRDNRRQAFGTMLWPVITAILFIIIISLVLRNDLAEFIFTDINFARFVPLVFIWASTEALFLFSLSYLRARSKIKGFSIIRLAFAITRMLVIVSLALLGYEFFWLVVGVILVQGLFVGLIFLLIFRDIGLPQIKFAGLKNYLTYSVPMLPGDVLFWIVMASDRYFITHFLSISQTGIYSASAVLANLIGLLSWPIGIVLFPAVTRLWEQKDIVKVGSYFQYSLKLFLTLAVPAAGGLYVLSQPLLNVFTTSEFLVEGTLILLLAIGELFIGISVINEYQIFLVKKTKWLPLIYAIGAGTNAGINIVLIPKIGIFGAAISTIVSYSLLSVIITFWGRKMIDYKLDFSYALKVVLATAIMIGCLWFIDFKGIIGVIALIIIGILIYGLVIFLLRAFSRQDMAIIKEALSGFKNKIKSS